MQAYEDQHGQLPPAVVYGEGGKPLHCWRVLLLPFIEQRELYREFRLDEPWDSPHNLALLPRMPLIYAPPAGKAWKVPPHHTVCHVFHGEGAAFEGGRGLRLNGDFPDGTSRTILLVEGGHPVPWTKPEELAYDPAGPLPDLATIFHDGFRVAMADGSSRWVNNEISDVKLRAAITRNGGEKVGLDW